MVSIAIKVERNGGGSGTRVSRRSRRALVAGGAVIAALAAGLAVGTGTAHASIVSIPPQIIANSVALPGGGNLKLVSSGGSTTVPTDATRVVFLVTITNATANGNVTAFATGSSGSGNVHYVAGTTTSGSLTEPVGLSNQVTFHNTGANSINLTVKITGYSTEVRASDISGTGGNAGQVLTNTGAGAAWQAAGHAYGVSNPFSVQALSTGLTTVSSVTVPAGSYAVTFSTTIAGSTSGTPDNVGCYLFSPAGSELNAAYGNTYATDDQSVITMQGLVSNTSGGTVTAQCVDSDNSASAFYPTLIANSVGAVDGYSGAAPAHLKSRPKGATVIDK